MSVIDRFLKYVAFDTTSSETSGTVPSTPNQRVLGEFLVRELESLGLTNARIDEFGYVYATLPATPDCAHLEPLGLIAHMDTSCAVSGADIKARIVTYAGGDLVLESGGVMSPVVYPSLGRYVGEELIVTDGTTLLGADDKAGIAEIISACEYLIAHPEISHRAVQIAFTPDEEIGCGADHFDVDGFGAREAYTVDGGEIGEIEYENFNAAGAKLTVHGLNVHPGSAKGIMKNAVLMANQFLSMLPPAETPAHTEGYEGFYHVCDFAGDETTATVSLIVRDHDRAKFEARKAFLARLCDYLNAVWGEGRFVLEMRDSYYNMKEKIAEKMSLITNAEAAMRAAGVEPITMPIRGGTDGARLSYMGILCPNLSTGGANFHGVHEYIPVKSMHKMVEVLVNLIAQP
ncbi:MAG: peptidase T [Ruminococcaceae bacterium]|nr:peptidase T [Oscillospiraceae bacterium]